MIRLLHGDCRTILPTLPDASVQCCVTSPPYWGLRDYGTAQWYGGGAGCDHMHKSGGTGASTLGAASGGNDMSPAARERSTTRSFVPYADICGKCGAQRIDAQIGLERTPEEYVATLVAVFREVRRILRPDGCMFLNLGDSFASGKGSCHNPGGGANSLEGHATLKDAGAYKLHRGNKSDLTAVGLKPKDLVGIPWMTAFALRADGWYLRSDIVWAKPNPMPESVRDRPTKSHEFVFLLTKSPRYYYDAEAIAESLAPASADRYGYAFGGAKTEALIEANRNGIGQRTRVLGERDVPSSRNARSVWTIATEPYSGAHFAVMPTALVERCIKAGTSEKGCCSACGAPWVRVTEKRTRYEGYSDHRQFAESGKWTAEDRANGRTSGNVSIKAGPVVDTTTTGWQPSCACDAPTKPCVVLDPFAGAGTVGLVADRLGRDAMLIELNGNYVTIQRERLTSDAPLLAEVR